MGTRLLRLGLVSIAVTTAIITMAALASVLPDSAPAEPLAAAERSAASSNPLLRSDGGTSNVTLYYHGVNPLRPGADLSGIGHPGIVVATGKSSRESEADQIRAIHSLGAKAYRYVQFYWAPEGRPYEGIDFSTIPGWKFCRSGSTPLLGRVTQGGTERWFYIDANEKAVRAAFRDVFRDLKSQGWDGVMFDRGAAATQAVIDAQGRRNWFRRSSCTDAPHRSGATFSDAYVHMLGLARESGLQAMMNNGRSPFDPVIPMRPNPRDVDCRNAVWSRCSSLNDLWSQLDLVLNETAARPRAQEWDRMLVGNRRSERDADNGRRTVAMITTASLGGVANQTRGKVFYQWARIKLFDLPVAVNTGDDRCSTAEASAVCNRYGFYPELVDTVFGRPLSTGPVAQNCGARTKIRCVWLRRYSRGLDVVNVSAATRKGVTVKLGTASCRYVYDVFHRRPLAGNRCVTVLKLTIPAWSGRPLKYANRPW